MKEPQDEAQRRRAVAWAIALTANTHLAPEQYETELLEQYAQGIFSLDQVLFQLDNRVQHILYRSQAVQLLTATQRTELLEQSRAWNEQHHITGLLCYSCSGHFVQIIEGSARDVHNLFNKIRQDKRHHKVMLLSDKASATRWFAGWEMAYAETDPQDFFWLIGYLDAHSHNLIKTQLPITEPLLLTLLSKFAQGY
jgi:hypothetical protein